MYEDFYGLSGSPFQLSPDPSFYFGSKGHEVAFSYLKYGLYQGEGFLVITGEVGAGKTTLVRALLEYLDPSTVVAAQIVSTHLKAHDLLRAVATAFGIAVKNKNKATLIASIEAFLVTVFRQNQRALLVIDEAQNLDASSIEELRMLSNFQYGDRALLQSFLVGQPELRTVMRSASMEQFRQRVIALYHLGPLDEAETRGYIEHRLQHVGWTGAPEFDDAAIHEIFVASSGIPRRINAICNRLLLAGFLAGQRKFSAAAVSEVVSEYAGEIGPHTVAPPLLAAAPEKPVSRTGKARSIRRLVTLTDRVEGLEQELMELQELVRSLMDAERAVPDEFRRNRPRRRRKLERRA